MTETRELDLGIVKITLALLSQQQIVRIMAQPVDAKVPVPPEGYTHEQALINIEGYRVEWADHQSTIGTVVMLREMGTSRALALDTKLVTDEEKAALKKLCIRYAFKNPDEMDDPLSIGSGLYEIAAEFGAQNAVYEGNLWLRNKAGFISDAAVQEVLKSLRGESERTPDTNGSGKSKPEEPAQGIPADNIVAPVRNR